MKIQDPPTGDNSGPSLSKEPAPSVEAGGSHGEDIKVRLVHLAHARRDDAALLLFRRKGW